MSFAPRKLMVAALLGAVAVLLFGAASPARADSFSQIINGLRSHHLYVSSEAAGALSGADQQAAQSALDEASANIHLVVVKAGTSKSSAEALLKRVDLGLGKKGTVAVLTADNNMAAGSHDLNGSKLTEIIQQSQGGSGLKDRITAFTQDVDKAVKDKKSSSSAAAIAVVVVLVVIVAGIVGAVFFVRRRKRQRLAAQMADLKKNIYEDVTKLGEDIAALNLNVTDPTLSQDIKDDYTKAMDSYDKAKDAVDRARRPEDMRAVTTALEDGRYYMMATRARLEGYPVPERRAPCFFNPQHGPSVRDVSWAPPGGAPREVPACAADAQRVESGQEPDARLVDVGGRRRPYWDAGPMYGPYAGGYYSGFGGTELLGGILIGTALGSMFSGGWGGGGYGSGYDSGYDAGYDAGQGDGGDSGFDVSGGDFDFGGGGGGGDWGGGDGGGDWGGGGDW